MKPTTLPRRLARRALRELRYTAWRGRWGARPYGEYHRHFMDDAARKDPREAVGGLWDVLGPFQLELLRRHGLRPDHKLLDIGCGSLRGGLHFIKYLEPENYWGVDISSEILSAGRRFVRELGLVKKQPHLVITEGAFREIRCRFDYVLAFGVFTDMPMDSVDSLLRTVPDLLDRDGLFLASFGMNPVYLADPVAVDFRYPWDFFAVLGAEIGLNIELARDHDHPKGHSILIASLAD